MTDVHPAGGGQPVSAVLMSSFRTWGIAGPPVSAYRVDIERDAGGEGVLGQEQRRVRDLPGCPDPAERQPPGDPLAIGPVSSLIHGPAATPGVDLPSDERVDADGRRFDRQDLDRRLDRPLTAAYGENPDSGLR